MILHLFTGQGDLIFFVNGVSQGVAASNLPSRVFAVIDMYGKCAQVTIMDNTMQVTFFVVTFRGLISISL